MSVGAVAVRVAEGVARDRGSLVAAPGVPRLRPLIGRRKLAGSSVALRVRWRAEAGAARRADGDLIRAIA